MPHFHRTVLLVSDGLQLTRVSCDGDDGPRPVEEHTDGNNVVLALRGRFTFRDRQTRAVISPSRGLVLTAGQTYTIGHPHRDGDVCLSVEGSFLSHLVEGQRITCELSAAGYASVQRLVARLTAREPVEQLAIEEALSITLSSHEWRHPTRSHDRAIAEAITHTVELHINERLPLDRLAFIAGVSVFHACRAFRRVMGTSIHRHQQEIRLRHALALVLDTQLPLAQIAVEAGSLTRAI